VKWLPRCKGVILVGVGVGVAFNGVVGAVAPGRLGASYGIEVRDPDVAVLLRHRAVLLALIGSGLVASAFRLELRSAAIPGAALSMAAYALFVLEADVNARQHRIAVADLVLLVLLAAAGATPEQRKPEPWRPRRLRAARHAMGRRGRTSRR
jgi:hypothetical protein